MDVKPCRTRYSIRICYGWYGTRLVTISVCSAPDPISVASMWPTPMLIAPGGAIRSGWAITPRQVSCSSTSGEAAQRTVCRMNYVSEPLGERHSGRRRGVENWKLQIANFQDEEGTCRGPARLGKPQFAFCNLHSQILSSRPPRCPRPTRLRHSNSPQAGSSNS